MKKNKFLKLASGLLVLCLLTTCVISTTFAKYVTSSDGFDTAKVAKWGVTVGVQTGTTDIGFVNEYKNPGNTTVTVSAAQDAVAPGTNGTLVTFQIAGTPEVSLHLDVKVTKADDTAKDQVDVFLANGTYTDWTADADPDTFDLATTYYPVKYTLQKKNAGVWEDVAAAKDLNLADMADYLETTFTKDYNVEEHATVWTANVVGDYQILWDWAFEQSNDKADTLLGNLTTGESEFTTGVATDKYSTEISFALEITATQID